MFTGIVQALGTIQAAAQTETGRRLVVTLGELAGAKIAHGDSVCVSGVCLTAVSCEEGSVQFDVIAETLKCSTLGGRKVNDRVNLELSLRGDSFVGGHFVQGHVDAVGKIVRLQENRQDWRITFQVPAANIPFIVPKGSIAVDGVSMTIAETKDDTFTLAIIPTTLQKTTLAALRVGDHVNVETDILARTVVHYLQLMGGSGAGGAGGGGQAADHARETSGIGHGMNEAAPQLPPSDKPVDPSPQPSPAGFGTAAYADPRPTIGITMGDPGGVGAEVIVKALADPEIRKLARYVIFGLNELMAYMADLAEVEPYWWRDQHERFSLNGLPVPAAFRDRYPHDVVVLDYDEFSILWLDHRGATKAGGTASMQFINDAIQAALKQKIDAIVTAPICKESWKLAGFDRWPGHTELLAEKTKARRYAMMFAAPPSIENQKSKIENSVARSGILPGHKGLRVVLCTIHQALFDLRNTFKIGTVFDPIDLAHRALVEWFGIEKPRIAVCGLNPHASENGLFGDEEKRIIEPAIMMARQHGIDATGPFPADTIFIKAVQGQYDLVVAMYHDQGLIPVKLLDFAGSVNITLGLPIIRTSPDHGTAFDIVGKNKADPSSMKAAILMAVEAATTRRRG